MIDWKIVIYLASGEQIDTTETYPEDTEEDEVLADLRKKLNENGRPGWCVVSNVLFHAQAVSAVTIEAL